MSEENTKFTAIFLKPDTINDGLAEVIISDLTKLGFKFVYEKPVKLTEGQAIFIYKDHLNNPDIAFAVASIMRERTCDNSLFLIAKRDEGDALLRAQEAKGSADGIGIRAKYRRHDWADLRDRGVEEEERKSLLSRNRIHIPDSDEHACQIIEMLIGKDELSELTSSDPEFKSFIEGHRLPRNPEFEGGGNREGRL